MADHSPRSSNPRSEPDYGNTRETLIPTPVAATTESPSPQRVGSYRIVHRIGVGGMGIVYLAEDAVLRRQVALKVLHRDPASDGRRKERFLREARATAAMEHDHIVRIYHADEAEGELFLVMEFLKGESLHSRLKREHRLKVKEAMRIAREAACGLSAAHARGLVHRDVTPANLWVETSGRVKILDFGLVHTPEDASLLSRLGAVMGTPGYMSPEQAAGESVTHATDLFSLGCVFYQMVTGEKAFLGDTAHALMRSTVTDHPRPPREINPEIPPPLDRLILQMLAKAEHERPTSAEEIVERLTDLLEPGTPKNRSTPPKQPPRTRAVAETPVPSRAKESSELPITTSNAPLPTTLTLPDAVAAPETSVAVPRSRAWREHAIAAVVLLIAATALVLWWRSSRERKTDASATNVVVPPRVAESTEPSVFGKERTFKKSEAEWIAHVQNIADLRARYAEVAAELQRRNPGLTGIRPYTAMDETIRSFEINSDALEDLSPLRALPTLQNIVVRGSNIRSGRLVDLEPLRGMGLVMVDVENTRVADLSPLEGMHLNHLNINGTSVTDLQPLQRLAELETLVVSEPIRLDLAPLRAVQGLKAINGRPVEELLKR